MCQRIATLVIGATLTAGRAGAHPALLYASNSRSLRDPGTAPADRAVAARADIPCDHSDHTAGRRGAHREGYRLVDLCPRIGAAPALVAEPDDSDVGAARHSDRLRPLVRRSRV